MPQSPFVQTQARTVPAVASGSDNNSIVFEAPYAMTISSVSYTPNAAITGANTNTRKVELYNRGTAGTGTKLVASVQFDSGVNVADNDEKALTLTATVADLNIAVGEILEWVSTHVGTGTADPGGLVQIEYNRQDAA